MKNYAQEQSLPDTHFKFETRESGIAIFAFKTFKVRIYGATCQQGGREVFVCTELAIKKKNKADPECLRRAARNIVALEERGVISR